MRLHQTRTSHPDDCPDEDYWQHHARYQEISISILWLAAGHQAQGPGADAPHIEAAAHEVDQTSPLRRPRRRAQSSSRSSSVVTSRQNKNAKPEKSVSLLSL